MMDIIERIRLILHKVNENPWMEQRLHLDELLEQLKRLTQDSNSEDNAQVLEMIKFIKFLQADCSGQLFINDKQWSDLMNLMQINRKLNHRSVKCKHIFKNKQLIEANAKLIKRLNLSAHLGQTIGTLIEKIEANLQECTLSLVDLGSHSDESEAIFLKVLNKTEQYLRTKCGPLIQTLRFELDNELVSQNQFQLDVWHQRLRSFELVHGKLANFLIRMHKFHANLLYLKPLVMCVGAIDNNNDNVYGKVSNGGNARSQSHFDSSLLVCKQLFNRAQEFNEKLLISLHKLANTQRGKVSILTNEKSIIKAPSGCLQLTRVLNSKNGFVDAIHGQDLDAMLDITMECRSILDKLMQSLRLEFGRFYFVNDLELLSIIALDTELARESNESLEVQRLISKLFNNSFNQFILETTKPETAGSKNQQAIIGCKNFLGEAIMLQGDDSTVPLRRRVNIYSIEIVRILLEFMRKLRWSLKSLLRASLSSDGGNAAADIDWELPVQLLLLAEQIKFNQQVEAALTSIANDFNHLERVVQFYEKRFGQLSSISNSFSARERPPDQMVLVELKRSALVSLCVHFMSILWSLKRQQVCSPIDWHWQKLPRYQVIETNPSCGQTSSRDQQDNWQVQVRIADACFDYKFDYLPLQTANTSSALNLVELQKKNPSDTTKGGEPLVPSLQHKQLVWTQTTERCFLVASQAVGCLKLGASPFGPAGSGKTETIKAFGQLLGCQVVVHNCDESNESTTLERLVWGLARTGLWGCFDEFNRLSASTLSSVAAQLELVQTNLRLQAKASISTNESSSKLSTNATMIPANVQLADGTTVLIDPDSAFFITLNPADQLKYRGRRQLPANLRSLFLPVAMCRLQIDLIVGQLLLASSGRIHGVPPSSPLRAVTASTRSFEIGSKLSKWLKWMQTECSQFGGRCEWDLRLIMAIVKRITVNPPKVRLNEVAHYDHQLVAGAIRAEIEPRLINASERTLLEKSLKEHFSNGNNKLSSYPDGEEWFVGRSLLGLDEIELSIRSKLTIETPKLIEKCLQLWDQVKNRAGVILVGATRTGKSTCWRQLQAASREVIIAWFAINPRSCTKTQLFGFVDEQTRKWRDGFLTKTIRDALQLLHANQAYDNSDIKHREQQVWIVLDGPIDPDWIECLNSVLDDNRILTLGSGERLYLAPAHNKCVKLLFETTDLLFASPATISRLGMVAFENPNTLSSTTKKSFEKISINSMEEKLERFLTCSSEGGDSLLVISLSFAETGQWLNLRKLIEKAALRVTKQPPLEYTCSEQSNSDHLRELVAMDRGVYLINNLESIGATADENGGDQWQARTFMELLRQMVTYGHYHDYLDDANCQLVSVELTKFILILRSDRDTDLAIDERILSIAQLLQVTDGFSTSQNNPPQEEAVSELLIEPREIGSAIEDESLSISSISSFSDYHRYKEVICNSFLARGYKILTCNTLDTARGSMDLLQKIVQDSDKTGGLQRQTDLSTSELDGRLAAKQAKLLLITQLEVHNMGSHLRTTLFHLLNCLKASGCCRSIKVIYLCNKSHHRSGAHFRFWQLVACSSLTINDEGMNKFGDVNSVKQHIQAKTAREPTQSATVSDTHLDWLAQKIHKLTINLREENVMLAYLSLINKMLAIAEANLLSSKRTLTNGLNCLGEFEKSIERIKLQLDKNECDCAKQQAQIVGLMGEIGATLTNNHEQQMQIAQLKAQQALKCKQIEEKSEQVSAQLSKVVPLIESNKCLIERCLKPEALQEIKTLRSPPKTIKDILDVLFVFLLDTNGDKGSSCNEPITWVTIKAYLTRNSLQDELKNYDFRARLSESLLLRVQRELRLREASFALEQASRASSAIVPIVKWIEAAMEYGRVLISVLPLEEELKALNRQSSDLMETMRELEGKHSLLDAEIGAANERLGKIKRDHEEATRSSQKIRSDLQQAQETRASLVSQSHKWAAELQSIDHLSNAEQFYKLCLLAASLTMFYRNTELLLQGQFTLPSQLQSIEDWLEFVEMSPTCRLDSLIAQIKLSLIGDQTTTDTPIASSDLQIDLRQAGQSSELQLQLILMKLCLSLGADSDGCPKLVPLLLPSQLHTVDDENNQLLDTNFLSHQEILCRSDKDLVRLSGTQWSGDVDLTGASVASALRTRLDMALKMNKLVVIELYSLSADIRLDLIDILLDNNERSVAKINGGILLHGNRSDGNNLINNFGPIIIRPFELVTREQVVEQGTTQAIAATSAQLLGCLTNYFDPELSASIVGLEQELESKQKGLQQMESKLLQQLSASFSSTSQFEAMATTSGSQQHNDLVRALINLHRLRSALEENIVQLSCKLKELQVRRKQNDIFAQRAAAFYEEIIVDLCGVDCGLSLDSFGQLLIRQLSRYPQNHPHLYNTDTLAQIDERLLCHAMLSMEPPERRHFCQRLSCASRLKQVPLLSDLCSQNNETTKTMVTTTTASLLQLAQMRAADLGGILGELLDDFYKARAVAPASPPPPQTTCWLAVILHDAKGSSPQREVDELFRKRQQQCQSPGEQANRLLQYHKLHATSLVDCRNGRLVLECNLARILSANCEKSTVSSLRQDKEVAVGHQSERRQNVVAAAATAVKCICITNAHLAANWLSERLLPMVREASLARSAATPEAEAEAAASSASDERLLIILIGERTRNSLATPCEGRRNLFGASLLAAAQVNCWHDELALSLVERYKSMLCKSINRHPTTCWRGRPFVEALTKQLVLFHVVCQELLLAGTAAAAAAVEGESKRLRLSWKHWDRYSFSYDQLNLALAVMDRILLENCKLPEEETRVRVTLCHYLEDVLYGSRMEGCEDEATIKRLIDRFLLAPGAGSADQQLHKFQHSLESFTAKGPSVPMTVEEGRAEMEAVLVAFDELVVDFDECGEL